MADQTIAGRWRGHYQDPRFPDHGSSAFTAVILENGGTIEGTVVDDSEDRQATISGSFLFPRVQFTKLYLAVEQVQHVEKRGNKAALISSTYGPPVEYTGTMTDDGKTLNGNWTLSAGGLGGHGTWTAYRLDEKEKEKEKEKTTDEASPVKVKKKVEQLVEVT